MVAWDNVARHLRWKISPTYYEGAHCCRVTDAPLDLRVPPAGGYTSLPPSGDNQIPVDVYPPTLRLGLWHQPNHLGTTVNESETTMTTLILNLTITPEAVASGTPAQDREVNCTTMYITYSDTRDLYFLDPGEYSLSWREGDDMLEPGEVVELTLPLQQPIPANTDVYAG